MLASVAACSDHMTPTSPVSRASDGVVASADKGGSPTGPMIALMDGCDPTTFAQQGVECARSGGVTFQNFLNQIQTTGGAGAWHIAPGNINATVGSDLNVVNRGGEVHTFTEVKQYGGGIVDFLNTLSGNTHVAPECLALEDDDFVPPGGVYHDEVDDGTTLYQCCIHPWMRTVVHGNHG